jgi:hypothetical protein
MNTQYEQPTEQLVLREVMRLHAIGRTSEDIATLIGANPHDIRLLIFGHDEERPA